MARVSTGAMNMKKCEFRNLRQGNRTVAQYVDEFSKLSRYAPDDVATDAAKQEKFMEGLNDELSMQLMVASFNNYQELVDRALMIEGKQQQIENRKRKYGQGKYNSGAQQKPRLTPKPGVHFQHTHGGGSSHNHNGSKNGNGNGGSNGQNRTTPSTPAKRDLSQVTCFKCSKTGHYANECPEGQNGNGSSGKKPNLFNRGQVNHVNVEEVEAQPDAVIGKFLVKSFTALVLFDTGASHSYISRGFVEKYNLPTKILKTPMLVNSPGAEYMARQGCFQVPLSIGRHVFPTDLIILESQGLDVILGMDWLSMYGGNIDCASKTILLTTPEGRRIKYVSRHTPNRTQVNSLSGVVQEEVPVVRIFLTYFPKSCQACHRIETLSF